MSPSSTINDAVAAELRAELARQRRTQADLAGVLNLSQPALSRRLLGQVPMSLDELTLIAAFLNVPVTRFLTEGAPA